MPKVEIAPLGKNTRYEMMLNAPRKFAWKLRFGEDYAPKPLRPGYRVMSYNVDYKEGGKITATMGNDEGDSYKDEGIFLKIEPVSKLVWELSSGCIHGLKIKFEEHFEDLGDQTKYTVDLTFENEELLSNAAELGCERIFGEYLENFGDLVDRMARTEKVVK